MFCKIKGTGREDGVEHDPTMPSFCHRLQETLGCTILMGPKSIRQHNKKESGLSPSSKTPIQFEPKN